MRLLFIISFSLFVINVWSQNYVFDKITTREGLSQNDVNVVYQSKSGFLWIGTNDGLNRYDGYNFKTYRVNPLNKHGIGSNIIADIAEDSEGFIWLASSDGGAFRFDVRTEEFQIFKNTNENPNLFQSNQIVKILPAKNGYVWIGTTRGVSILKPKDGKYEAEQLPLYQGQGLEDQSISVFSEDIYGKIWIGTKQGVFIYSQDGTVEKIDNLEGRYVKDIYLGDREAFIAYINGVYKYSIEWETLKYSNSLQVSNVNADCIVVNETGDLFIGTGHGLYIAERDKKSRGLFKEPILFTEGWEANNLSKNLIMSLYEDNSGIIWIGTNGGGLNKYNPKQKKFRHFLKTRTEGSISYNKIRSIYQDSKKNIWIGTEGGGMNFLSNSQNKNYNSGWEYIDVEDNDEGRSKFYTVAELDSDDGVEIFAGIDYPLVVAKINVKDNVPQIVNSGIFSEIRNSPFDLLRTKNDELWIGTYGVLGLFKYVKKEDGEEVLTNFVADGNEGSLSSNRIRSLLEDDHDNIWIGTDNGLNLLTAEEREKEDPYFYVFKRDENNPGSISHNYILPLFSSEKGIVWVGTMGGGLNRVVYDSIPGNIRFKNITTEDGLPNNVIKGILEDDYGFLWISSNKGLTRYDVEDNLFVNFGISDGLQDYEFGELACCKLHDGEMLFGGVNGFNAFYPKDIVSDMSLPRLALTDFHILNRSIVPGEKRNGRVVLENVINHTERVRLKYSQNSFSIYFSSLHFSAPEKNEYKYMLEGFDEEWVRKDATERVAKYTNLRPGDYTFKVVASNNDGIWTNDPRVLKITITPPWYLSNVAWATYVILFIGITWFFQRYSLIRIKQKNELLMEHFEKEKIQELSQMKLRFFTNISHEFRTPLTLIIGPLEKLIRQGSTVSEKKIAESYALMHRNASILLRLINQLVDFRKFEQGKMKLRASGSNIVAFLNEVFSSFNELAENKKIDYHFTATNEDIKIFFDADKLERIMYNLLSNAFKFTMEGGQIILDVSEDDKNVIVKVIDNGVGIPKDMQKHIFERFYQAERINNIKTGSTGIGLSFIKGLVEMHKGEICFESTEGKGTTFILTMKKGSSHLKKDQLVEEAVRTDASKLNYSYLEPVEITENEPDSSNADTPKQRVLVVEDNFELRQFIKNSLNENYHIDLAENGKEALDKIPELAPDVIVSDIMMPVMNGFELCEAIKSNEEISHIPIILLTAKSSAENRIKGYNLGADGYISKPFGIEVLVARINNLIESRQKLKEKLRTNISVEPSEVTTTSMDERFLQKILKIIEENISNPDFTVEQLASDYGMSQIVLNRKLKGLVGQTAKAFIRSMRLKRAAQLFTTGRYSVTDVTYEVGFTDLKYFRSCFKNEFDLSPSEYIKENKPKDEA